MNNYMLVSEATGEPLMDGKGMPVTWMDIMLAAQKYAEEIGCEIEHAVSADGEDMFRLVKKDE